MEELSEEQIEEFKEAFSLFDQEGKGHIFTKELGTVLRSLGIHTTDEEKNMYIEKFDTNSEGLIYFKDFLEIIITKIADTKPEEELAEAFRLFDNEKLGFFDVEQFKLDVQTYADDKIDEQELDMICNTLRPEGNVGTGSGNTIKIDSAVQQLMAIIKAHLN